VSECLGGALAHAVRVPNKETAPAAEANRLPLLPTALSPGSVMGRSGLGI
jgi:hypothetical protein